MTHKPAPVRIRLTVMLLVGVVFCTTLHSASVRFTILHTNDLHQSLEPLSRIAGYVDEYRRQHPDTVFVDAGDWFDRGSSLATITRGEAIYGTMAQMGYDMTIAGNHDWAYGDKRLCELVSTYKMPLLGSNLGTLQESLPPNVERVIIKEFGGMRVGFIGITLDTYSKNPKSKPHLHVTECHAAVKASIAELKDRGVNVIVAVTHLGFEKMKHETRSTHPSDVDLAKAYPDLDVIVGGHSHTILPAARTQELFDETGVVVVQAGSSGRYVGQLVLDVDPEQGRVQGFETTRVEILPKSPELPAAANFLREMYAKHMPNAARVVGEFEATMEFHNLAYWYADFLRRETSADVVLLPRKCLYDEPKAFRKGKITVERLRGYLYDWLLVRSHVSGTDLISYLQADSRRDKLNPFHHCGRPFSGDALFVSGMEPVFRPETREVDLGLEPDREYVLVTPWPFAGRDVWRYRHQLPPRSVASAAAPVPGLSVRDSELVPATAVELLLRQGLSEGLSFTRRYPEPRPDWAAWTDDFEAKLKPGAWRSPRTK